MKRVNYFFAGMMLMLAVSCVAPEEWEDKFDKSIVPDQVSNVQVENVNGGAIVSYTLPSPKKDLLGAKVIYSLSPGGEVLERWASAENNSIELEGYGDTNERTISVYTVHKNGNVSEGVSKEIKPLTPPIFIIRESMTVSPTWSGIQVEWDNPLRKDMGIALWVEDSISGEIELYDKHFSNSIHGKNIFRTFKSKEQNFRIEMFDRWQNYAQPLETAIIPLAETEIMPRDDRGFNVWSLFDDLRLGESGTPWRFAYRCDMRDMAQNRPFENVFDWWVNAPNIWNANNNTLISHYVPGTTGLIPFPLYVTFDMGRKAVYSRFLYISRHSGADYSTNIPVEFDVWGTNDPKLVEDVEDPHGINEKGSKEANQAYWSAWELVNGTDAWKNDWVKLATCKIVLSSGDNQYYAGMPLSAEDLDRYFNGFEFDFNLDVTEAFRYLRWEIFKTNANERNMLIAGIRYWGSYAD